MMVVLVGGETSVFIITGINGIAQIGFKYFVSVQLTDVRNHF
jgi:hypothetical protein